MTIRTAQDLQEEIDDVSWQITCIDSGTERLSEADYAALDQLRTYRGVLGEQQLTAPAVGINPDLVIPDFLVRLDRWSEGQQRKLNQEAAEKRAAHRTAKACRNLLTKERRQKAKLSRAGKKARNRRAP